VICFSGPHINHLTPRTLDIDQVQARMTERGMQPKALVEGPPRRAVPILLRQTSFQAVAEPIIFHSGEGGPDGVHAARFGEVEQRGLALTREGRALYDRLLAQAQAAAKAQGAPPYPQLLAQAFAEFPDDETALRQRRLAFFRYRPTAKLGAIPDADIDALVSLGFAAAEPITYEDFLPVSAAGIFRSNLASADGADYAGSSRQAFEAALGAPVADEIELYAAAQSRSKRATMLALLQRGVPASDHYLSWGARRSDLIVHLTGLALALIGGGMLLGLSIGAGNWRGLTAAAIYALGLVTMLALSTAYNFSSVRFQPLLRRFDHAGIFVMIAASYTPFTTQHLHGAWAWGMTSAVWGIAGLGAAAKLLLPGLGRGFWVAVYLLLGWLVLVAVKPLLDSVGLAPLILLAVGGGLYTVGVCFYAMKRFRFRRAVWHGFVVAAAAVHWTAVLLAIVRGPAA
jgi:hemolysin III